VGEPETDRVAGHQGLERVRVLRIIARLNIGGPALHTTLLTERLDPRRYDARLIAGTEGPDEGNCLLAVSDTVRAELLSLGVGSPKRFRVMPLGLDLERYVSADAARGVLRSELGLAPDVPW
jgi:hypothetical protein